jgi:hypothetical protein
MPTPFDQLGPLLAAILPSLGVGTLVGGVIVAIIKRGTDKDANAISEKDVNTRATTMTIDVLTEGLREIRLELSEAKARIKDLEESHRVFAKERIEMINHIELLEKHVPTPPGAPERPDWSSRP